MSISRNTPERSEVILVTVPGEASDEQLHSDHGSSLFLIWEREVRLPLESPHAEQALIG